MNSLDPNKLFSIFESNEGMTNTSPEIKKVLDNPYVVFGMVLRGLENYHMMDVMYQRRYPEDYEEKKNTIKYNYFERLYNYLTRINLKSFEEVYKVTTSYPIAETCAALDEMIMFYESVEYYERCAKIKEYADTFHRVAVDSIEDKHFF